MISVKISVSGDEVLFRLDQLPKRIREEVGAKFQSIFLRMAGEITESPPGKYIDPMYIQSGVEQIGSQMIGFIEVQDKPGVYAIYPSKAKILRFVARSGDIVRTRRVLEHPFLKGVPIVERYLRENKPWVLEEIQDAVTEAINARK